MNQIKNTILNCLPFNNRTEMSKIEYVIKRILGFYVIYYVSTFVAEGVIIIAHYIMGYDVLNGEMMDYQTMSLFKFYGYIVFIMIALLYCRIFEKRRIRELGFKHEGIKTLKSGFLVGGIIAIVLLVISIGLTLITGNLQYTGIADKINYKTIILFFGAYVIQGTMEEVLCRGYLMTALNKKVSLPLSIFISSTVFAIPHFSGLFENDFFYSLVGVINLYAVSVIFSLLMYKAKNIYISCGMHSIWNFALYNIFGLNVSGVVVSDNSIFQFTEKTGNIMNGGVYGIEAGLIAMFVLVATAVLLSVFVYKGKKR